MRYKAITAILFTLVGPTPKPNITVMVVPETSIQAFLSIGGPPISVNPIHPSIPLSLQFNFLQSRMANIISESSIDRDIGYRYDLLIARRRCSEKLHLRSYLEMLWSETGYF